MKRQLSLLAILAVSLTIAGDRSLGTPFATRADGSSSSQGADEQTTSFQSGTATWEYKIVRGAVSSATRVVHTDNRGRSFVDPGPFVEEEINKLAAQGYVVDGFQTVPSLGGSGYQGSFQLYGSAEVVVLLKRIRR